MTVTCFSGNFNIDVFQRLLFAIEGIQVANPDMCVHENIFSLYFTVYLFKLAEIQRELMLMIKTMMVRIKAEA